jgi:hypothetical protein
MEGDKGPGALAPVHRVTIAAAFVCFLGYGGWEFYRARDGYLLRGIGALLAAAGTGVYLRTLDERLDKKLTPRHPADR